MARHDLTSRSPHRRRGIASLEFVLILPVLLVLLFGVIEYGWMLAKQGELVNATREGARVGARTDSTPADIQDTVDTRLAQAGITGYTTNITPGSERGDIVTVSVSVPYSGGLELTGLSFIPVPGQLSAEVSMNKEGP